MWKLLLHRFFNIGEPPDSLRFGSGVVGHTTHVMIAFFVGMGAIAWALDAHPYVALGVIGLLVLIVGFFLIGTWRFADKHPDQAAMGDSVWLKFREFQMGTKSQPILVPLPAQSDPVAPSFFKVDQPNLSHQDDLDGDG